MLETVTVVFIRNSRCWLTPSLTYNEKYLGLNPSNHCYLKCMRPQDPYISDQRWPWDVKATLLWPAVAPVCKSTIINFCHLKCIWPLYHRSEVTPRSESHFIVISYCSCVGIDNNKFLTFKMHVTPVSPVRGDPEVWNSLYSDQLLLLCGNRQ